MKPWEETWRVGSRVKRTIYVGDDITGLIDTEERAALVAAAPELYRALESAIEFLCAQNRGGAKIVAVGNAAMAKARGGV